MDDVVPRRFRDVDPRVNDTDDVLDAAIEVQRALGSGLLEKPYELALAHELRLRNRHVRMQVPLAVGYKGLQVEDAYVLDLEVDERVVVEVKAVETIIDAHLSQLVTYLRFGGYGVGLLVNFRAFPLKLGVHRVVNPFRRNGPRQKPSP